MKNLFKANFWRKYWWDSAITVLSLSGIVFGVIGFYFLDSSKIADSLYEIFRMFLLNYQFDSPINVCLEISRWSIFFVFLLVSFKLFITIITPRFVQNKTIQHFYKKHIVICGLNEVGMELIGELKDSRIVVITNENHFYNESLKRLKIKTITGNIADQNILDMAGLRRASQLYAVTDDDKKNIEIAHAAFSLLKEKAPPAGNILKCFTLIKDKELKIILEETALFKYAGNCYDGILFNISEMGILGIKYGICMNIDKILPCKMEVAPEILIVGLTDKAENVIHCLAHCLTMSRETFRFTIVEESERIIESFKQKCPYLQDFAEFEYIDKMNKICDYQKYASVFVCLENQIAAIKKTIAIRNTAAENKPNIVTFCDESETLYKILNIKMNNQEGNSISFFQNRNIYLINSFAEIARYLFDFNKEDNNIEAVAKKAHDFWSVRYGMTEGYDNIPEHFKESNRNQILDNYLRTYIVIAEKFDFQRKGALIRLSDSDMETLAMTEHRRWMIEKYYNGWRYGEKRNNEFKIHPCLMPWDLLPANEKEKDYDVINFMIDVLNDKSV